MGDFEDIFGLLDVPASGNLGSDPMLFNREGEGFHMLAVPEALPAPLFVPPAPPAPVDYGELARGAILNALAVNAGVAAPRQVRPIPAIAPRPPSRRSERLERRRRRQSAPAAPLGVETALRRVMEKKDRELFAGSEMSLDDMVMEMLAKYGTISAPSGMGMGSRSKFESLLDGLDAEQRRTLVGQFIRRSRREHRSLPDIVDDWYQERERGIEFLELELAGSSPLPDWQLDNELQLLRGHWGDKYGDRIRRLWNMARARGEDVSNFVRETLNEIRLFGEGYESDGDHRLVEPIVEVETTDSDVPLRELVPARLDDDDDGRIPYEVLMEMLLGYLSDTSVTDEGPVDMVLTGDDVPDEEEEEKELEEKSDREYSDIDLEAFGNLPSLFRASGESVDYPPTLVKYDPDSLSWTGLSTVMHYLYKLANMAAEDIQQMGADVGERARLQESVDVSVVLTVQLEGVNVTNTITWGDAIVFGEIHELSSIPILNWIEGFILQYGSSPEVGLVVEQIGLLFRKIGWRDLGACGSSKMKSDKCNGYILKSPRAREGMCGLACIVYYVKKQMKESKDDERAIRLSDEVCSTFFKSTPGLLGTRFFLKSEEWSSERTDLSKGFSCAALGELLKYHSLSLFIYSRESLFTGKAIYESEVEGSLGTVQLCLHNGHYAALFDPKDCKHCGKKKTNGRGVRHRCEFICEYCKKKIPNRRRSHECLERSIALNEEKSGGEEEEKKEEVRMEYEEKVNETVALILENNFIARDEKEVLAWRATVCSGRNCLLLGEAGTGKTTVVRNYIRDVFESRAWGVHQVLLTSWQGVATSQYRGLQKRFKLIARTVHSTLGKTIGKHKGKARSNAVKRLSKLRLLIIDEISSCPVKLFLELDQMCREAKGKPDTVFGGIQVVCVGDFGQAGGFELSSGIVFDTDPWHDLQFTVFTLIQQRRMSNLEDENNRAFLRVRLEIYRGIFTQNTLDFLNAKRLPEQVRYSSMFHLLSTNLEVFKINTKAINEFRDVIAFWPEGGQLNPESSFKDLKQLQRVYDLPLRLAKGATIIFTDNYYLKKYGMANGSSAKVECIVNRDLFTVSCGSTVINVKRRKFGGRIGAYFAVKLGFARTTYKCQGCTMDRLCVWPSLNPKSSQTEAGLLSMCITRCRSIENFYIGGRDLTAKHFCWSPRMIKYMEFCGHQREELYARAKLKLLGFAATKVGGLKVSGSYMSKRKKSAFKGKMNFYTRETPIEERDRTKPSFQLFHKLLIYDYETFASCYDEQWRRKEKPYGVYANMWRNERKETFQSGVDRNGLEEGDMNARFCKWVYKQCQQELTHRQAHPKSRKKPIIMVAYNGSGFDHVLFIEKCIAMNIFGPEWTWNFQAIKGAGRIVCASLDYKSPESNYPEQVLRVWDPCLWLATPLSHAFKDFASSSAKQQIKGKDCFPHDYITRVGPKKAFEPGEVAIAISEFPKSHQKVLQERISKGSLKLSADKANSVLFNCNKEYLTYVRKDVECLEYIMEAMQLMVWYDILPGENLPITNIATAASFSQYAFFCVCEKKYMLKKKEVDKLFGEEGGGGGEGGNKMRGAKNSVIARYSKILRPTINIASFIRRGIFGGCCMVRRKFFISSKRDKSWNEIGNDAISYVDANGLYHFCLMEKDYPYGHPVILHIEKDAERIKDFMGLFRKSMYDKTVKKQLPLFMAELDVFPNNHDVEPFVPHREKAGSSLLWTVEPKYESVYTSVDLRRVLALGGAVENVKRIIIWGNYDKENNRWHANKGKIFAKSGKISASLRKQAKDENRKGLKTFGKLIINSLYGSFTQRDVKTVYRMLYSDSPTSLTNAVISASAGESNLKLVCFRVYPIGEETSENVVILPNGLRMDNRPVWVFCKFERQLGEDDYTAKAPQIGAFCLSYSRGVMSKAISRMLGEKRFERCSLSGAGIYYSDTDSLFVSYELTKYLKLNWVTLGEFADDLEGIWMGSKNEALTNQVMGESRLDNYQVARVTKDGDPKIAKIIRLVLAAKKVYGGKFVCPYTDKIYDMKVKAKGVPREGGLILSGKEFDRMAHQDIKEARLQLIAEEMEKKEEGRGEDYKPSLHLIEERARHLRIHRLIKLREIKQDSNINYDILKNCGKTGGIVVTRSTLRRTGLVTSDLEQKRGQGVLQLQRVLLTRHILSNGNTFSEDRVPLEENENLSMPKGWVEQREDLNPQMRVRRRLF